MKVGFKISFHAKDKEIEQFVNSAKKIILKIDLGNIIF
jgi:hypothetical protein